MNLGTILQQTGAIDSIAGELGIDPQVAKTGAAVLLPAILAGMGRSSAAPAASSGGGLGDLVGAIAGSGGGGLLDLVLGNQPTPVDRGNDILGQIFGNKDVSRSVAAEAAGASGMSSDLLKKMLPLLAMAVAGYLAQQGKQGAPAQASGPDLGGLLGTIIGGLAGR
ncbi:MAG: DUF937 domain-containing protein [Sphingomonadaceae bacterium]